MRNELLRIAIALEAGVKKMSGGGDDMGAINIYPGDIGVFITTTLKHFTLDELLQGTTEIVARELIPCPQGKRIAVLGGKVGSKEKMHVAFYNGDPSGVAPSNGDPFDIDSSFLPTNNYILPPTTIALPHYMTSPGRGLYLQTQMTEASDQERKLTGYLKYVFMDV